MVDQSSASVLGLKDVLIAGDTPTNWVLLKAILEKEGYEVREAADGIQCLEQCQIKQPDAVLLDMMMPQMDGFTASGSFVSNFRKRNSRF